MVTPAANDARAPALAVTPPHAALPRLQTLPRALPACVLAFGAHLKNKACLVAGTQVFWSDAHGDLADVQACRGLQASADRLLALAREQGHAIQAVAHDLHPDFFSTRLALQTAEQLGVPAIPVQHHHAHVAVLLAEAGRTQATTGLALDGYGMGSDGGAWGGELLRMNTTGWQRLGRLSPLACPAATRPPLNLGAWRRRPCMHWAAEMRSCRAGRRPWASLLPDDCGDAGTRRALPPDFERRPLVRRRRGSAGPVSASEPRGRGRHHPATVRAAWLDRQRPATFPTWTPSPDTAWAPESELVLFGPARALAGAR
jgi:hypothetical protein